MNNNYNYSQQGGYNQYPNQPPQQYNQGGYNQPPPQYNQGGFNQGPQYGQQQFNQPPQRPSRSPQSIIQSLQYSIQYYRIDLGQLFNAYKSQFSSDMSYNDFSNLLLRIDNTLQPQDIQACFQYFDKNGDRSLSFQEFHGELQQMQQRGTQLVNGEDALKKLKKSIDYYKIDIPSLFSKYDTSRNQRLDYNEFRQLLLRIDPSEQEQNIQAAFTVMDHDQQGTISLQEFQHTLYQINCGQFSFQNQQQYHMSHQSQWGNQGGYNQNQNYNNNYQYQGGQQQQQQQWNQPPGGYQQNHPNNSYRF